MSLLSLIPYLVAGFTILMALAYTIFRIAVRRGGRWVEDFDPSDWIITPEAEIGVKQGEDGNLHLLWRPEATRVGVYAGTEPDKINLSVPVQEVNEAQETIVRGLDPEIRHFFTLKFSKDGQDGTYLTTAERFLPLITVANLRDLGGYNAADSHRVKWGRVYRSGDLSRLSAAEAKYLQRLGIKLVCDLRSTREVESKPDVLPAGTLYLHCPVYEDEFPHLVTPVMLFSRHKLGETLGSGYTDWLEIGAPAYGRLFETMADPDNLPILLHCTAGKDRAGIASAILLSLLGVPDETIIADYSLTNLAFDHVYADFLEENRLERLGIPGEEAKIMLAANPAWIRSTLEYLHEHYGGVEGYLRNRIRLSASKIKAIRENLW